MECAYDVELCVELDGDVAGSVYHISYDMVGYPCEAPGYEDFEPEVGAVYLCDDDATANGREHDSDGVQVNDLLSAADVAALAEEVRDYHRRDAGECEPADDWEPEPWDR